MILQNVKTLNINTLRMFNGAFGILFTCFNGYAEYIIF